MSTMHFDGPIDVTPEFVAAMWKSIPKEAQPAVAQNFFYRAGFVPYTEQTLKACAHAFFEREKIGGAAAAALREGVADKCRALGDKIANPQQIQAVLDDEIRKAAREIAKAKIEALLSALPMEAMIAAAAPAVVEAVKALANQYFSRTQEGQQWILGLIERIKADQGPMFEDVVTGRMADVTLRRLRPAGAEKSERVNNDGLDTGKD